MSESRLRDSFSGFIRLFLPGVFAEAHHWRERALNAEARLSELLSQIDAIFNSERQEHRAERERLLGRLGGDNALPLPPSDDGGNGRLRSPVSRSNPIARAYDAARAEAAQAKDELIEEIVDDYLKMNAITNLDSFTYDDRK